MLNGLRWIDAGNAGPFALEGTRTHIVGRSRVAVVDPGPPLRSHVDAVVREVESGGAEAVALLLTHGHPDHAGAAAALAARLGAPVLGAWGRETTEDGSGASGPPTGVDFRPLADGERVATDAGELVAVSTPGHAREHLVFHWPQEAAVFVGDLVLGAGETTWVGAYPGCVADYLASLERVERLGPRILLPAHGPPVTEAALHIELYRAHRLARIGQAARALAARPEATLDEIFREIYGGALPPEYADAARASVAALVEHVRGTPA